MKSEVPNQENGHRPPKETGRAGHFPIRWPKTDHKIYTELNYDRMIWKSGARADFIDLFQDGIGLLYEMLSKKEELSRILLRKGQSFR